MIMCVAISFLRARPYKNLHYKPASRTIKVDMQIRSMVCSFSLSSLYWVPGTVHEVVFSAALKSAGSSRCYQTWAQRLYDTLTSRSSTASLVMRVGRSAGPRIDWDPESPDFKWPAQTKFAMLCFFCFFFSFKWTLFFRVVFSSQ